MASANCASRSGVQFIGNSGRARPCLFAARSQIPGHRSARLCVCSSRAEQSDARASRRQLVQVPLGLGLAGLLSQLPGIGAAFAADRGDEQLRSALMSAINDKKGDKAIEQALRQLADKGSPVSGPGRSDKLFGKWKLLWASPNSEVARATSRNPLPSYSEQLVGEPGGEKKDRAANVINIGNGAVSNDTILIGPPFYLELKLAGFALPVQNTQKEGERKSLLGAEQNYYKQLYLEGTGKPGDLRISEVTFGDPAAKGSIFVHERV